MVATVEQSNKQVIPPLTTSKSCRCRNSPVSGSLYNRAIEEKVVPTTALAPWLLCNYFPGYQISWEVYGRNESRLARTLPNTTLEYKITGLSSLTTYTIEVAAVTAKGSGWVTSSTISSGVPPGWWNCTKQIKMGWFFMLLCSKDHKLLRFSNNKNGFISKTLEFFTT